MTKSATPSAIKTTLLNSTPIVTVDHKYDTSYSILPLGEWIVDCLRARDGEGELIHSGAAKAEEGRRIKNDVAIFKLDKDDWKEVTSHYSVIRKGYDKEQRDLCKRLDVKSARHWDSGKITISMTPDAVEEAKVDGFKQTKEEKSEKTK